TRAPGLAPAPQPIIFFDNSRRASCPSYECFCLKNAIDQRWSIGPYTERAALAPVRTRVACSARPASKTRASHRSCEAFLIGEAICRRRQRARDGCGRTAYVSRSGCRHTGAGRRDAVDSRGALPGSALDSASEAPKAYRQRDVHRHEVVGHGGDPGEPPLEQLLPAGERQTVEQHLTGEEDGVERPGNQQEIRRESHRHQAGSEPAQHLVGPEGERSKTEPRRKQVRHQREALKISGGDSRSPLEFLFVVLGRLLVRYRAGVVYHLEPLLDDSR